jgi:transposase InsO family protein
VEAFTYVATWSGIVCVAFVVDVFSRAVVGWSVGHPPLGRAPRRPRPVPSAALNAWLW